MKQKQKGFFKNNERPNGEIFLDTVPIKFLGDSLVEINGKSFIITPNIQNVFTDTSSKSFKKLDEVENTIYKQLLKTPNFEKYAAKPGECNTSAYKVAKTILKPFSTAIKDNLKGKIIEKIIIPSNIIDIYSRLQVLLGSQLS